MNNLIPGYDREVVTEQDITYFKREYVKILERIKNRDVVYFRTLPGYKTLTDVQFEELFNAFGESTEIPADFEKQLCVFLDKVKKHQSDNC